MLLGIKLKIQKNSILDLSEKFYSFEKSLEGYNYIVDFESIKFDHFGLGEFSTENLKELFGGEEKIRGSIILSDFETVINDIKHALSYFSNDQENQLKTKKEEEKIINEREKQYWRIITPYFKLPPKIVYKHNPASNSYFNFYVMWGFCYILLNDKDGLLIAGQSWD